MVQDVQTTNELDTGKDSEICPVSYGCYDAGFENNDLTGSIAMAPAPACHGSYDRRRRSSSGRTKVFLAEMPSIDTLREVFDYDDRTGKLFWRKRPASHFTSAQYANAWNARWAGKEALASRGRVGPEPKLGPKRGRLTIDGRMYQLSSHRVIWALIHGEAPTLEVRHNDGELSSNRSGNLRQVTRRQIADDWRMAKPGLRGAYRHSDGGWWSGINDEGRQIYLGRFKTPEEASAAWHKAYEAREARISASS